MSKIAIKGNESGTATFTIEAPATNTDRIFELPDEAGKILTNATPGTVLQVVSTTKNDTFSASLNTNTEIDVTGLAASITPTSINSKILVTYYVHSSTDDNNNAIKHFVTRNGTKIGTNTTVSGIESVSSTNAAFGTWYSPTNAVSFLDEPSSTSSLSYQVRASHTSTATRTIYVNRPAVLDVLFGRYVSTITLMEIAG